MPISIVKGNLFTSSAQTLVNTVNCVGVMGAGVAFEFRLRYPEMFARYRELCQTGHIKIGSLWLYKASPSRLVLNFPTKGNWKLPSRVGYLEAGLRKFSDTYFERGITSVAFPVLGAGKGGIPERTSLSLMEKYLAHCPIPIEIYRYDPAAVDDLYLKFGVRLASYSDDQLTNTTGIRTREIGALRRALAEGAYRTLSQLLAAPGVGEATIERCFKFVMAEAPSVEGGQLGLGI